MKLIGKLFNQSVDSEADPNHAYVTKLLIIKYFINSMEVRPDVIHQIRKKNIRSKPKILWLKNLLMPIICTLQNVLTILYFIVISGIENVYLLL